MNPLLAVLPAAARAVVPSVLSAVARGASQREVVGLIRQAGLTYSLRNPWAPLLSYARDASTYNDRLRYISGSRTPNLERLPFSLGETRRKYSWTVRLDLRDEEGSKYETFVTVSTDKATTTIEDIKEAAMKHGEQYDFAVGGEIYAAVVVGGTRRWDT